MCQAEIVVSRIWKHPDLGMSCLFLCLLIKESHLNHSLLRKVRVLELVLKILPIVTFYHPGFLEYSILRVTHWLVVPLLCHFLGHVSGFVQVV